MPNEDLIRVLATLRELVIHELERNTERIVERMDAHFDRVDRLLIGMGNRFDRFSTECQSIDAILARIAPSDPPERNW